METHLELMIEMVHEQLFDNPRLSARPFVPPQLSAYPSVSFPIHLVKPEYLYTVLIWLLLTLYNNET